MRDRAFTAAFLCLSVGGAAWGQSFVPGDIYIANPALANPSGTCFLPGVMRIVPGTWATSILVETPSTISGRAGYDAFRRKLLVGYVNSTIETVDAAGARVALPYAGNNTANVFAPTGDGRIYIWGLNPPNLVAYYDSANAIHPLLDSGGVNQFTVVESVRSMTYDAGTHALFFAAPTSGDLTKIIKVPLNAAGTAVLGATVSVSFDASAGNAGEVPVSIGPGPSGQLFVAVDDNTNNTAGRLRLVDPVGMGATLFATPGYFGVAGETAGAYVPSVGGAVVLDTLGARMRLFGLGGSGEGTILPASGVASPCGSGEAAQFVVITAPTPRCGSADFNCDGDIGTDADIEAFFRCLAGTCPPAPCNGSADFNADGDIGTDADIESFFRVLAGGIC